MYVRRTLAPYVSIISLALLLLAIGGLGYLGFLAFVKGVLAPKEFATYGLVLTTLAAATASYTVEGLGLEGLLKATREGIRRRAGAISQRMDERAIQQGLRL